MSLLLLLICFLSSVSIFACERKMFCEELVVVVVVVAAGQQKEIESRASPKRSWDYRIIQKLRYCHVYPRPRPARGNPPCPTWKVFSKFLGFQKAGQTELVRSWRFPGDWPPVARSLSPFSLGGKLYHSYVSMNPRISKPTSGCPWYLHHLPSLHRKSYRVTGGFPAVIFSVRKGLLEGQA